MANTEISDLEKQIFELTARLNKLRKSSSGDKVRNYAFDTIGGGEYIREQTVMDGAENEDLDLRTHCKAEQTSQIKQRRQSTKLCV